MAAILLFSVFTQSSKINVVANAQAFTLPCTINTTGNAWDGNITFGLIHYDSTNTSNVLGSYLINMKTNGTILNLRQGNSSSGDYFEVKYINQSTIMFEGEAGLATHFWNLNTNQTVDYLNINNYHHDICYNPINDHFLMLKYDYRNVNGTYVLYDKIEEANATGGVVRTWYGADHIPISWASQFNETVRSNNITYLDLMHSNAIMWDYQENILYLNARHIDTFWKINLTSGDIIWGLGKHGNFTLLDATGKVVSNLWYHSHSTQEIAPGYWMMFDNDYNNETNPNNDRSRLLIISVNETSMKAQEVWSWEAPLSYYTFFFGKADVLPNGNRLGTFGAFQRPTDNTTGAIIVEVTPQGQVVRTWTFPKYWAIYRVIPQGQVADAFGLYQEPTIIPEFDSTFIVTLVIMSTTGSIALVKYRKQSKPR